MISHFRPTIWTALPHSTASMSFKALLRTIINGPTHFTHFYPTVLWTVHVRPRNSHCEETATMTSNKFRNITLILSTTIMIITYHHHHLPCEGWHPSFSPQFLQPWNKNFNWSTSCERTAWFTASKPVVLRIILLIKSCPRLHQAEVESWEHCHNTLPLEMLSVENKNRSWMSQKSALWLLASSFSEPARACRTLMVPTALASTSILVNLT